MEKEQLSFQQELIVGLRDVDEQNFDLLQVAGESLTNFVYKV